MENYRNKIVMVDDNMANLTMIKNMLKNYYAVYPATSAAKLFEILESVAPDLILLDVEMPEMNGYEAIKKLKADDRYKDIPVIFVTSKRDEASRLEGFDLGAADYIMKPFLPPLLLKRIANQLLIAKLKKDINNYADNLEHMVNSEVTILQNSLLSSVAELVEKRDQSTDGHIQRIQLYLKIMVEQLIKDGVYEDEVKKWDINFFLMSAYLHDIGKIAISDYILNKPGKLDFDEYEIIKTHATAGTEAIEGIMMKTEKYNFLSHALYIAGTHHEKWDGTGYPAGLKGKDIPLEGRLMAIVDVYDALISERPYKGPVPHAETCKIIEEGCGTHFDPALVEVFKKVKDEFAKIVNT